MDLIGKFKKSEGFEYVLTMIDVFTRFTIVVPIKNKQAATIAEAIHKHLICVFGIPESILTDQGSEFCNQGLKSMCRKFNITKLTCSPNSNSKGNGHCERWHRFVNSSMSLFRSRMAQNGATTSTPWCLRITSLPTSQRDSRHTC